MPMSVTYATVDGRVLQEVRGGAVSTYMRDPLGNTIGLLNALGVRTDSWTYWPYGEVQSHTGSSTTPLTFLGTLGYFVDYAKMLYVRARHLRADVTRWMTEDPLWPDSAPFIYGNASPHIFVDPEGTYPIPPYNFKIKDCEDAWAKLAKCSKDLSNEWAKYNPWTDCLGGFPTKNGKPTVPYGHALEIANLQRCVAKALQYLYQYCGGNFPPNAPPDVVRHPVRVRPQPQCRRICIPTPDENACKLGGLALAGTICYWIISEGTRLFPPRNLVPIL